jgi:hypothetical protein
MIAWRQSKLAVSMIVEPFANAVRHAKVSWSRFGVHSSDTLLRWNLLGHEDPIAWH